MSVALVLSAVVAVAIGLALSVRDVAALRRHPSLSLRSSPRSPPGVGLGITGVGVFCWLVLLGPPDRALVAVELAMLILLLGWIRRGKGRRASRPGAETRSTSGLRAASAASSSWRSR